MSAAETPKRETTRLTPDNIPVEKAKLLPLLRTANLKKVACFSGFPDPDGLACTFAMEHLLQKLGAESVTSFYKGTFNRAQNKTFRTLLNISVQPEEKFEVEDGYTCIIAIDAPATLLPVQPDIVIDHHEQEGSMPAKIGSDVRFVGATSSIILEYLIAAEMDFNSEVGQRIATALLIGIITDTKNGIVETTCELDYQAMSFCHRQKDQKLFKEIINYPRPTYYNDLFCLAWNNKTIEGTLLVSGVGVIPEARSGILSDLAERFVEIEGVRTSVIFAIVDNYIDISIRSNSSLNVDEFVKTAFGGGGGKPGAGRSRIPLPVLFQNVPDPLSNELYDICVKIVKHKVLQIAGDKK